MTNRTPVFVALVSTGLITFPTFAQVATDAQNNSPANASKRLNEQTWSEAGSYEWTRPDNVRFVLVRACGGGGGGGGGHSVFTRSGAKPATGGGGGAGSAVATILLGPLTAPTYTVVIGSGGKGAESTYEKSTVRPGTPGEWGSATSFSGDDLSFETPGAVGGHSGNVRMGMSEAQANAYVDYIAKPAWSGGTYQGGGAAQTGQRGLLGLGGTGNAQADSGGGGGSVGKGGAGGAVNASGSEGGYCAGGGGAGYSQTQGTNTVGGRGGDGALMLISMGAN